MTGDADSGRLHAERGRRRRHVEADDVDARDHLAFALGQV
jgi:hypothetical protein